MINPESDTQWSLCFTLNVPVNKADPVLGKNPLISSILWYTLVPETFRHSLTNLMRSGGLDSLSCLCKLFVSLSVVYTVLGPETGSVAAMYYITKGC